MATNMLYNMGDVLEHVDSTITHADPGDGFVDSEQPVLVGSKPGVALTSAAAATDNVSVAHRGVFTLAVDGNDAGGDAAVSVGDIVYMTAGGVLDIDTGGTRFGYALGAVTGGAVTAIPVAVGY